MTREELEKRVHEFAVEVYKEGYKDGVEEAEMDTKTRVEGAYAKGLEDAWDCARKLMLSCGEGGYDAGTIADIFGMSYQGVLKECKPNQVIKLFKEYEALQKHNERKVDCEVTACYNCINHNDCDYEYEEKQTDDTDNDDGSIKVGDEVSCPQIDSKGIVIQTANKDTLLVLTNSMDGLLRTDESKVARTGRTFPQIAEVLEK